MKWRCRTSWPDQRPEWGEIKKVVHDPRGTYAATPSGEIFILDDYGQWERRPHYLNPDGYLYININRRADGMVKLSRKICAAYYGKPLPGQVAAHLNNRRTDNSRYNLRWTSQQQNVRQSILDGRHVNANRPAVPRGKRGAIRRRNEDWLES